MSSLFTFLRLLHIDILQFDVMLLAEKAICKLHCKMHVFPILFCGVLKKADMIVHSRKKHCAKVFLCFNELFSAL